MKQWRSMERSKDPFTHGNARILVYVAFIYKFVCDGLSRPASAMRFFFLLSLPWQRIKSMRNCDVFVVLTWRHYLYVCSCTAYRVISAHERKTREEKSINARPVVPNFKTLHAIHSDMYRLNILDRDASIARIISTRIISIRSSKFLTRERE